MAALVSASGERAASAGGGVGAAATGDGATAVNSRTDLALTVPSEAFVSPADIPAGPGLRKVPDEPRNFVGRRDELHAISKGFDDGAMMQVLYGLGGTGKTTLAAQWTVHHADQYHPVWWVDGRSAKSIAAGLARFGGRLQDVVANIVTPEALSERAQQWLMSHSGWLLVLDNVNDPDDVRFLKTIARDHGRVLITSRLAAAVWHDIATAVPVPLLSEEAAVELFTRICTRHEGRVVAEARRLCAELGFLALAVQQAAAYCLLEEGMTPHHYLAKLAEFPDVMHQAPYEGSQLERTMAGVWEPSLDRLADTPLAGDVLRTLAWFPPAELGLATTNVPRPVLRPLAPPPALHKALLRLAAHSLIGLDQENVRVHRLVQAVARTPSESSAHRIPQQIEAARARAEVVFGTRCRNDFRRGTS
ncbi:NB-ARC domain-containing protein [Streptomyces sp. NPDC007991]|uniref:NB-ARC domain-containing protein n=1 Tax=Streptomyces sp. NPDC007991 TaxID=3364803 RepID=UPI0036EFA9FD